MFLSVQSLILFDFDNDDDENFQAICSHTILYFLVCIFEFVLITEDYIYGCLKWITRL